MNIEVIEIEKLVEYENNAKIHTLDQIEQIKKSIQEFGFNDPIAIDENNIIIEGHGRLYALKELGYKEIDCIRLTHLDEQQKKAYILAHNKLTMNTGFDFEMLQNELKQIDNFDMTDFGFEIIDIEKIEDFFEENESPKEKEKQKHICPECGHEF